jgi:hypothetical protein
VLQREKGTEEARLHSLQERRHTSIPVGRHTATSSPLFP